MRRGLRLLPILLVALLVVGAAGAGTSQRAPKPGTKCHQPGYSEIVGGRTLTCRAKGKAGVWVVTQAGGGGTSSGGSSGSSGGGSSGGGSANAASELVIVADPYDLSQVRAISKFRSCAGHDYSGLDIQGHLETNRSMKHYVAPTLATLASPGLMNVYAPFAGTVTQIMSEQVDIGKQLWITSADGHWQVRIFHTDPLVQQGQTVTAGMLLGHPEFASQAYGNPNAFVSSDIALVYLGANLGGEVFDSIFEHMTPSVYAQWTARGVTADNAIVSQAARDAAPCTSFQGDAPDDYVTLTP